jgi:hypothetical protein
MLPDPRSTFVFQEIEPKLMSEKPPATGYFSAITDEATAREAVKMGGLPILALGVSMLFLARTSFTATTMPLSLLLAYVLPALVFIAFAFRIRSGRAASLPYLAAVFFCFAIAELVFSFIYSAGSVGEGWAEISVLLTHVVTFLAAFLAYRGVRGWRYLKNAGLPMRF